MKRKYSMILAVLVTAAVLAGCGGNGSANSSAVGSSASSSGAAGGDVHVHVAGSAWERDAKEHWHLCECGEVMDAEAHDLDDLSFCETCGSEVIDFGDSFSVYVYDENDEVVQMSEYDAAGSRTNDWRCVIERDADGNKVKDTVYQDGVLTEENEYVPAEDGESRIVKWTYYDGEGGKTTNEYDEDGNIIRMCSYAADGALRYESISEYAVDAEGESYECRVTTHDYEEGYSLVCTYNEYEDIMSRIKYDANDQVLYEERYERGYNDEGQQTWEKTFRNGVLIHEITGYAEGGDDSSWWRYPETIFEYYEDGSYLKQTFGTNAEVETETRYYPDGTAEYIHKYVYETDDEGNWSAIKIYEWDRLISHAEYKISSDGWSYKARLTEWNADGSYRVFEYDESEELVSETAYDANGKEIPA